MGIKGENMENKYYKFLDIIFYIAILIMAFHLNVTSEGWIPIICLWLFLLYFLWYDMYANNKKLAVIPLWLYLIVYYVINWKTMYEILKYTADAMFR